MKRLLSVLAAAAVVPMFVPGAARADTAADAATSVRLVNDLRARHGVPALQPHPELEAKAAAWARVMADAGRIWHSDLADGITADWSALGENVGMGSNVERLHEAFVSSPRHYDNLVKPSYEFVGIAVAEVDGMLYVAQEFMTLHRPAPTTAPPAPAPAPAPVAVAPAPVAAPAPAPVAARPPRTSPKRTAPTPRKPIVAGEVMRVAPAPAPSEAPADGPAPAAAGPSPAAAPPETVDVMTEPAARVSSARTGTSGLAVLLIVTAAGGGLAVRLRMRAARGR